MKKLLEKIYVKSRMLWHGDLYDSYIEKSIAATKFSFMQNQALLNQNINWDNFGLYRFAKQIHMECPLYDVVDKGIELKRCGRDDDGGYIMLKPFSNTKIAYSIGIADDVSWDLIMANDGYEVYQYDHTIDGLPIQNRAFHWEQIGLASYRDKKAKLETLKHLLARNGHINRDGMVLKMDIEGCEWDIFETMESGILDKFDQIILELHWLTSKYDRSKVLNGLRKLNKTHAMVHVHANNFEPLIYTKDIITPDVMEATFVNKGKYHIELSETVLPREMDVPCCSNYPDLILGGWNAG